MKAHERIMDLGRRLKQALGGSVAVFPDHPFLLTGPDILIASRWGLAGVFVAKSEEMRAPDIAAARMAIARLAFPDGFQTVLVLPEEGESETWAVFAAWLRHQFDAVIAHSHFRQLEAYIKERPDARRHTDVDPHVRQTAFHQAEILYQSSLDFADSSVGQQRRSPQSLVSHIGQTADVETRPWAVHIEPRPVTRRSVRQLSTIKGFYVGEASLPNSTRSITLTRFGRLVFTNDYSLDNGRLFPKRRAANILVADRIPEYRGDPTRHRATREREVLKRPSVLGDGNGPASFGRQAKAACRNSESRASRVPGLPVANAR
jgi:hypothetical protein